MFLKQKKTEMDDFEKKNVGFNRKILKENVLKSN